MQKKMQNSESKGGMVVSRGLVKAYLQKFEEFRVF